MSWVSLGSAAIAAGGSYLSSRNKAGGGGKGGKADFSQLYGPTPQYSLEPGSLDRYKGQIQSLVDLFGQRSRGEDQFDYMKFLYQPQEAEVNRQYGINQSPGDQYQGSLQRTLSGLNQRGLLDAGTSGVIQAQLEADRNRQLAELFGQARIAQRGDIDNSYSALAELYPSQFEAAQIQPNIDYSNAMSMFNQDFNRNNAQQNYEASKPASPWASIIGSGVGSLFGQSSAGGSIGNMFGGGGGSGFKSAATSTPPSGYNLGFNPFGNVNKAAYPAPGFNNYRSY